MTTEERKEYMKNYMKNYRKGNLRSRTKLTEEEKKQKIAEWRDKNRDKIKERNKNYRIKQKIAKLNDLNNSNDKTIQPYQNRKIVENYPTKIKNGVDPDYLTYQIIICKGMGKLNKELTNLFIKMLDNLIRKFTYVNSELREDCYQHALMNIIYKYKLYNEEKYDNAFAYVTEILKRDLAAAYNLYNSNNFISLSKFENYY